MSYKILGSIFVLILSVFNAGAQLVTLSKNELKEIKPISLKNYSSFKASAKSLIEQMANNKIVGLGEGTHGTAEFIRLRYFISRMLIEDYGFNHVAFENDVTEVWQLNQQLNTTNSIKSLMKKYLLTLWQNEETKEFLIWLRKYNTKTHKKINLHGIDYPAQLPDILMIKQLLTKAKITSFTAVLDTLAISASKQDAAWSGMNNKDFKADWSVLRTICKQAYLTTDSIEKAFQKLAISEILTHDLLLATRNLKQGFEPFYKISPILARDSIMAINTVMIVKNIDDKIIVWAHNAHLGKTSIFGNAVGGTGGYILKHFPDSYFALGTSTAEGTFGGTTDVRAVNNSPIAPYRLELPITDSWEAVFSNAGTPNFYIDTKKFNTKNKTLPLRFIGYDTRSGADTYDKSNLIDLFDAFIFLKSTHAPKI